MAGALAVLCSHLTHGFVIVYLIDLFGVAAKRISFCGLLLARCILIVLLVFVFDYS